MDLFSTCLAGEANLLAKGTARSDLEELLALGTFDPHGGLI
jgi:hypothetical protein